MRVAIDDNTLERTNTHSTASKSTTMTTAAAESKSNLPPYLRSENDEESEGGWSEGHNTSDEDAYLDNVIRATSAQFSAPPANIQPAGTAKDTQTSTVPERELGDRRRSVMRSRRKFNEETGEDEEYWEEVLVDSDGEEIIEENNDDNGYPSRGIPSQSKRSQRKINGSSDDDEYYEEEVSEGEFMEEEYSEELIDESDHVPGVIITQPKPSKQLSAVLEGNEEDAESKRRLVSPLPPITPSSSPPSPQMITTDTRTKPKEMQAPQSPGRKPLLSRFLGNSPKSPKKPTASAATESTGVTTEPTRSPKPKKSRFGRILSPRPAVPAAMDDPSSSNKPPSSGSSLMQGSHHSDSKNAAESPWTMSPSPADAPRTTPLGRLFGKSSPKPQQSLPAKITDSPSESEVYTSENHPTPTRTNVLVPPFIPPFIEEGIETKLEPENTSDQDARDIPIEEPVLEATKDRALEQSDSKPPAAVRSIQSDGAPATALAFHPVATQAPVQTLQSASQPTAEEAGQEAKKSGFFGFMRPPGKSEPKQEVQPKSETKIGNQADEEMGYDRLSLSKEAIESSEEMMSVSDTGESEPTAPKPILLAHTESNDDAEVVEFAQVTPVIESNLKKTSWFWGNDDGKEIEISDIEDAPNTTMTTEPPLDKAEPPPAPHSPEKSQDSPDHPSLLITPTQSVDRNSVANARGFGLCWLFLCFVLFTIVTVAGTIGTAFYGTELALRKNGLDRTAQVESPSTNSPVVPAPIPPPLTRCRFSDVPLEFEFTFDSNPADVGILLQTQGSVAAAIWSFPAGSFRSFVQLQRANTFSICLSPTQNYVFQILSQNGAGMVSTFAGEPVYGYWDLMYNNSAVASYNGDCSVKNATDCGAYCACSYTIFGNGSTPATGQCTTHC